MLLKLCFSLCAVVVTQPLRADHVQLCSTVSSYERTDRRILAALSPTSHRGHHCFGNFFAFSFTPVCFAEGDIHSGMEREALQPKVIAS